MTAFGRELIAGLKEVLAHVRGEESNVTERRIDMAKNNCPEPDADDSMMGGLGGISPKMPMQAPTKKSSARPPRGVKPETKLKQALKGKFSK